jgi:hypothetical protein
VHLGAALLALARQPQRVRSWDAARSVARGGVA